jgi:hypothetical protein
MISLFRKSKPVLNLLRVFSTSKNDNDLEVTVESEGEVDSILKQHGYDLTPDQIKGIKHREGQKSGILMMMYTCAVEGCGTK